MYRFFKFNRFLFLSTESFLPNAQFHGCGHCMWKGEHCQRRTGSRLLLLRIQKDGIVVGIGFSSEFRLLSAKKFKILLHKIESHRLFLQIFELIWNRLLLMCFKTLDDVGLCISAKFLRNYWKKIDSLDVPKHHDPLREYKETTDHQSPITLFLWLAIQCNFVGWKDLIFLLFCKILVQNVYHLRHQYDWWKIVVQVFRPSV